MYLDEDHNVYVDGFNLYYGCLKGTAYRWLDLEALCARLLPKNEIHRIRYFTAKVGARPGKPRDPVHQQAYLRALSTLPTVGVHLGHFPTTTIRMALAKPAPGGPKTVEVSKTEEKGSVVTWRRTCWSMNPATTQTASSRSATTPTSPSPPALSVTSWATSSAF